MLVGLNACANRKPIFLYSFSSLVPDLHRFHHYRGIEECLNGDIVDKSTLSIGQSVRLNFGCWRSEFKLHHQDQASELFMYPWRRDSLRYALEPRGD